MKKLTTEITIDGPPSVVWETLRDFASFPEWNPFVISLEGDMKVGSRLLTRIQPPNSKATTFKPTVTAVVENEYFEWLGHLGIKGLFDGRHQYKLEATDNGTRFIQSEEFTGVLAPFVLRLIGAKTEAGFAAMNQALKERAEQVVAERG